jgi:hypothetical protein
MKEGRERIRRRRRREENSQIEDKKTIMMRNLQKKTKHGKSTRKSVTFILPRWLTVLFL